MSQQLVTRGTVVGFLDGQPDFVRVSDGFYNVVAYIPGDRNEIQVGQQFNLYMQNNMYYLGIEVNR